MATSSIFKKLTFSTEKSITSFPNAIKESEKHPASPHLPSISVKKVEAAEAINKFFNAKR